MQKIRLGRNHFCRVILKCEHALPKLAEKSVTVTSEKRVLRHNVVSFQISILYKHF